MKDLNKILKILNKISKDSKKFYYLENDKILFVSKNDNNYCVISSDLELTEEITKFLDYYEFKQESEQIPEFESSLFIEQNDLKSTLKRVLPACSKDETRKFLQTCKLEITNNNFRLIATDGYRIHIDEFYCDSKMERELVIDKKILNIIKTTCKKGNLEIKFLKNNFVEFKIDGISFICPDQTDNNFLEYKKIMPDYNKFIEIDRNDFFEALKKIVMDTIVLEIKENLIISDEILKLEVPILNGDSNHLKIGICKKFLMDVIKNLKDNKIKIEFTNGVTPITIIQDNFYSVIGPRRID